MKKKYRYKFSPVIFVLFAAIYALALTALVWNGIRLFSATSEKINLGIYNTISLVISLILPIVFIALVTLAIINSNYSLSETALTVNFGVLKDEFKTETISSVIKNVRYSTLSVTFKDGSAYKIVIDEKDFDDFSAALIKLNKNIVYGETDEEIKKK